MHCKTCEYPLWNLKARQCPECGAPFLPSEFDFVLNSVRFCCPHCEQVYYGTGPTGHLVPASFECVTCHRAITMDEMVLRPAEGVQEQQTKPDTMPWLDRRECGWMKAWFGTVGKAMITPGKMMSLAPVDASLAQAWLFLALTSAVVGTVMVLPQICLFGMLPFAAMGSGAGGRATGFVGAVAGLMGLLLAGWIVTCVLGSAVWGGVAHGLLRLTGATPMRIGRTYQAICYSSGASVPSAVPCLGFYFGWVWWVVSAVIAVKEAQKVSGGRAAFAVLTVPVLGVGSVIAAYVAFVVFAIMANSQMAARASSGSAAWGPGVSPGAASSMQAETQHVLDALLAYSAAHQHAWPGHGAELVDGAGFFGPDFVSANSLTTGDQITIGGTSLDKLAALGPNRRQAAIQRAAKALPPNVVAHRVGDFVFTYHGIDAAAEPSLWVVVMLFDPDANGTTQAEPILAGLANGQVVPLDPSSLPMAVTAQNAIRQASGLPPLPIMLKVTHDSPAVGGPAGATPPAVDPATQRPPRQRKTPVSSGATGGG